MLQRFGGVYTDYILWPKAVFADVMAMFPDVHKHIDLAEALGVFFCRSTVSLGGGINVQLPTGGAAAVSTLINLAVNARASGDDDPHARARVLGMTVAEVLPREEGILSLCRSILGDPDSESTLDLLSKVNQHAGASLPPLSPPLILNPKPQTPFR